MFFVLTDMWKLHDASTANLYVPFIRAFSRRVVSVRSAITAIS